MSASINRRSLFAKLRAALAALIHWRQRRTLVGRTQTSLKEVSRATPIKPGIFENGKYGVASCGTSDDEHRFYEAIGRGNELDYLGCPLNWNPSAPCEIPPKWVSTVDEEFDSLQAAEDFARSFGESSYNLLEHHFFACRSVESVWDYFGPILKACPWLEESTVGDSSDHGFVISPRLLHFPKHLPVEKFAAESISILLRWARELHAAHESAVGHFGLAKGGAA